MKLRSNRLRDQAKKVLIHAEEEARRLNHDYVGTEHILLGLVAEGTGEVAAAFRALGVDAGKIRREIAALVQPGLVAPTTYKLPQTPRARRAVEFANVEAMLMKGPRVGPERLLLGLMRERDGVAVRALRNLGLTFESVSHELFKSRLWLAKLVERIVRPVRAGTARKRPMRDELLAHLTEIYDEELARLGDPSAAMQAAAHRFGDPIELTAELQATIPTLDLVNVILERWFGWRAPESAAHYLLRLSSLLETILAALLLFTLAMAYQEFGWTRNLWIAIKPIAAMAIVVPPCVFLLGLNYFKMRDAMFGVFGSRKSLARVLFHAMSMAVVVWLSECVFIAIALGGAFPGGRLLIDGGVAGVFAAFVAPLVARVNGPIEIRDTLWACLDIEDADDAPQLAS